MKDKKKINKAVITAAGFGTRFLPATKNQPKEMLPIIDKPIIHYLVEEAVSSGIEQIILVTRAGTNMIEDYFDNSYEVEATLESTGKEDKLEMVRNIPQMANFIYVRQRKHLPYGNGSPLIAVKDLIDDDEAFVYMWGDDLTLSKTPVTKQIIETYNKFNPTAVFGVQEVPWEVVERYGTVKYKENPKVPFEIEREYEKLPKDKALSNMAQFGRFVFNYEVIEEAQKTPLGKGNELWITDILNNMAQQGKHIIAQPIDGEWLTTGDPLNYLRATLKFAMMREDLSSDLESFIRNELLKL